MCKAYSHAPRLRMQVVEQAHAVVLASGTLSPVASLTRQLFPSLPPSAITHFSCGHVIPKEQLLALAVPQVGNFNHSTLSQYRQARLRGPGSGSHSASKWRIQPSLFFSQSPPHEEHMYGYEIQHM